MSFVENMIEKDRSFTVHTRNIQILAIEMFKAFKNMSAPIFSKIFQRLEQAFGSNYQKYLQ